MTGRTICQRGLWTVVCCATSIMTSKDLMTSTRVTDRGRSTHAARSTARRARHARTSSFSEGHRRQGAYQARQPVANLRYAGSVLFKRHEGRRDGSGWSRGLSCRFDDSSAALPCTTPWQRSDMPVTTPIEASRLQSVIHSQ
jgi:hypothetical protein